MAAISIYSFNGESSTENHEFTAWKAKFNKRYSEKEEAYRLSIWLTNLAFVQAHNAKYEAGLESYSVEMNQFADMDSDEFGAKYLIKFPTDSVTSKCTG